MEMIKGQYPYQEIESGGADVPGSVTTEIYVPLGSSHRLEIYSVCQEQYFVRMTLIGPGCVTGNCVNCSFFNRAFCGCAVAAVHSIPKVYLTPHVFMDDFRLLMQMNGYLLEKKTICCERCSCKPSLGLF